MNLYNTAKTLFCLLACTTFFSGFIKAQSNNTGIKHMELFFSVSPFNQIENTNVDTFAHMTLLDGKMSIELSDTLNIDAIQVKVIDTLSGSYTNYSKTFDYHTTGTFADGTSYQRKGKKLTFYLGTFRGVNNFYSEAIIKTSSNTFLSPYTHSQN